jgi:predicted SAM-dependent methyltransferase
MNLMKKNSNLLSSVMRKIYQFAVRKKFSIELIVKNQKNIILGAGPTKYKGWISTDKNILDITSPGSWSSLFKPGSIDSLLAEHVFEHLSKRECETALVQCYHYLKPGGLLRIAVPDGYRRDSVYLEEISPPKDDHKIVFTIDLLEPLLKKIGFKVTPLEFFDKDEKFHAVYWDEKKGFISRSKRFDTQIKFQRENYYYTSLIVDAKKL